MIRDENENDLGTQEANIELVWRTRSVGSADEFYDLPQAARMGRSCYKAIKK